MLFYFCVCYGFVAIERSKKLIPLFCSTEEKIIELSRLVFPNLQTNEKFPSLALFEIRHYNDCNVHTLSLGKMS